MEASNQIYILKKSVVTGGTVVQRSINNPKITGLNLPSGSEREKNF